MRLDHVSYACGPDGLEKTANRISEALGLEFVKGGVHPRFGTRNVIFPLKNRQYLEVVEVLDHPSSLKAPFGQAVRARSEMGGGWMSWAVYAEDLAPFPLQKALAEDGNHARLPHGVLTGAEDVAQRQIHKRQSIGVVKESEVVVHDRLGDSVGRVRILGRALIGRQF